MPYAFDGTNDYIKWNRNAAWELRGDLTLAAWAKSFGSTGESQNIIGYAGGADSEACNYLYGLSLEADARLHFVHEYGAGVNVELYSTAPVPRPWGLWHHYLALRDATSQTVTFYVDGTQLGDPVSYSNQATGGADATVGLVIGGYAHAATTGSWYGRLGQLAVWNRCLTSTEQADLQTADPAAVAPGLVLHCPLLDNFTERLSAVAGGVSGPVSAYPSDLTPVDAPFLAEARVAKLNAYAVLAPDPAVQRVSKLNAYAVLYPDPAAIRVSKLNAYAILNVPPAIGAAWFAQVNKFLGDSFL